MKMNKKLFTSVLASALVVPAVVVPASAETPFKDMAETSPYAEAVTFLKAENIITGYGGSNIPSSGKHFKTARYLNT